MRKKEQPRSSLPETRRTPRVTESRSPGTCFEAGRRAGHFHPDSVYSAPRFHGNPSFDLRNARIPSPTQDATRAADRIGQETRDWVS